MLIAGKLYYALVRGRKVPVKIVTIGKSHSLVEVEFASKRKCWLPATSLSTL